MALTKQYDKNRQKHIEKVWPTYSNFSCSHIFTYISLEVNKEQMLTSTEGEAKGWVL